MTLHAYSTKHLYETKDITVLLLLPLPFTLAVSNESIQFTQFDKVVTMLSPPALSNYQHKNSVNQIMESIFSYNSNIMLAAIVSLLLVILFVLILHIYAKWFLAQAQAQARRRRRRASVTVTHVLGPARFQHFHAFSFEDSPLSNFVNKGLDAKSIAAIPLFVFDVQERKLIGVHDDDKTDNVSLECVVCLSAFEDGDIGRTLPKCGHAFHIDCIDMWLHSHSSCPICRAPIMVGGNAESETQLGFAHENDPSALIDIVTDTEILEQRNETISIDNNIVTNGSVEGNSYFLLGCSLQRMLSKVFPSSIVNESNA